MQFAWRLPVPLKCEWREKDAVRFYPISIPQRIRGQNRVPPVYFRLLLGYTARLWAGPGSCLPFDAARPRRGCLRIP